MPVWPNRRKEALTALRSAILAITTGAGFNTTVAAVRRYFAPPEDSDTKPRPVVMYSVLRDDVENLPSNTARVSLWVEILGYVDAEDDEAKEDAVSKLQDDLIVKFGSDPTLGGMVTWAGFTTGESSEGIKELLLQSATAKHAELYMLLRINYHRPVNLSA